MAFTFDLLIPKSIEVFLGSCSINVWSIISVCQKEMESSCGKGKKFKVQTWPWLWPLNPKIDRGTSRTWSIHVWSIIILWKKENGVIVRETVKSSKSKYVGPFDPKIIIVPPWVMVKHMCEVSSLYGKRQWSHPAETTISTDRQMDTDGWTAMMKPV